jgi:DNA-binding XRE family transcriptional regulator
MSRPKPNTDDLKKRKKRAAEWKQFRKNFLFTQKKLADTMADSVGAISRRTIQQIEAAKITPHPSTLRLFAIFKKKHESNAEI